MSKLKKKHKLILTVLETYLEKNPDIRFGQALGNLNINKFADEKNPENQKHQLRDIYYDTDDVIVKRIFGRNY